MNQTEQDYRLEILNSLLTSTHRELDKNYDFHKGVREQDPLFYERLASWYSNTGDIRDHKHLFIANLCMSEFDGHREVGLALLRQLAPYELVKVVDFVRGKRTIPRSMRTEITRYLKEREQDHDWFDNAVITARKQFKRLYALLHIAPGERAQAILFDENPPKESKVYALKQIAKTVDPTEQAKLINEYRIPYRIASTVIKQITPPVLAVLIDVMTAQELISNMGSLQKHGAFNNPDIKNLVEEKLKKAKSAKNVSALKGLEAVKAAGLSEELNEKLQEVVDTQVKNKGRIKRATALLVDKSASMDVGIELAKQVATLISAIMDSDFYVYAFDQMPYVINAKGNTHKDWEQAFRGIRAANGSCPDVAIMAMLRANQKVEQIVMVTDEGENYPNMYRNALQTYSSQLGIQPNTVIIRCAGNRWAASDRITKSLREAGLQVDDYEFKGQDYYSLPNIIHFLTKPSRTDLLMEIMSYPLPERKNVSING